MKSVTGAPDRRRSASACLWTPLGGGTLRPLLLALVGACLQSASPTTSAQTSGCTVAAAPACYQTFTPPGAGGALHYYASAQPLAGAGTPSRALVVMHGHPRDANKTFNAALQAVRGGAALAQTLVVAPVFQVAADRAGRCSTAGVPEARDGDLLWTCASWLEGGAAENAPGFGSFAALDALVDELIRRWPSLRVVTIAGFSAGAQMVQHYIGFAADRSGPPALRYVVADPGSWLYFDPVRPQPTRNGVPVGWAACGPGSETLRPCTLVFEPPATDACPQVNRWKYGTERLPDGLGRDAAAARQRYAAADIHYLEGALDSSDARGTAYGILDKSCAAMAQGPFRMQRGQAYAHYERAVLAPERHREVVLVPGCAHDVACVLPSPAARAALLGADAQ